jgi:hypothetical protein
LANPDQQMFTDLTNCARKTAFSETEGHAAITNLNHPWSRGVERSGGQPAEPSSQEIDTFSASVEESALSSKDRAATMKIAAQ